MNFDQYSEYHAVIPILELCNKMTRHFCAVIILILFTAVSLFASSKAANIGVGFTERCSLFIDQVPFTKPHELHKFQFKPLEKEKLKSTTLPTANSRYWLKIPASSLLDTTFRNGYFYFGNFERILVYQEINGSLKSICKMGILYKKVIRQISPHYDLFPIDKLDQESDVYVQLSSGFYKNATIETVDPYFIPLENLKSFRFRTSFEKSRGIIQLGLQFYILFIILLTISYNFIFSSKKLLGFTLVCVSFFIFSLRHVEGSFMTVIFWCNFNEGLIRFEILCRVLIFGSFATFAFLNFKLGRYERKLLLATVFVFLFGLSTAINYSVLVGPYNHFTSSMVTFYFLEILFTISSCIAILFLIWKNDKSKFGKVFVITTLLYVIVSYCGLWLNTTWLGQLDNFFSSKMYSTYSIIIYLGTLTTLAIKDLKKRENDYQFKLFENKQLISQHEYQTHVFQNMYHEFSSPITLIQAALEDVDSNFIKKELIKKSSQDLLKLATQIRNISSIKNKDHKHEIIHDDLVSHLKYLVDSFESLAEKKELELSFTSSHIHYELDFEEESMRQIMSNILSNAIAFTPELGSIEVSLDINHDNYIITILDTGAGIPKENLKNIFNREYSNHSNVIDDYAGMGLGLAIVQDHVHRMNGTIECQSYINTGTIFTITLPIQKQIEPTEEDRAGMHHSDEESPSFFSSKETVILVVEDNEEVRSYIRDCLSQNNQIITACNGSEGFKLAKKHMPDLIISDISMPILNGYQLIELLKQNTKTDHIPIILLTGKSSQKDKETGLTFGADLFLIKPFNKIELQLTVSNILLRIEKLQNKLSTSPFLKRKEIPEWLQSLHTILENQLDEDLSVDKLSHLLFMSRAQLHRKLKALTGKSISLYIKEYKMKRAKVLLEKTNTEISEIAFSLGYKNPGHFSTYFKKYTGKSPSEYRLQLKN